MKKIIRTRAFVVAWQLKPTPGTLASLMGSSLSPICSSLIKLTVNVSGEKMYVGPSPHTLVSHWERQMIFFYWPLASAGPIYGHCHYCGNEPVAEKYVCLSPYLCSSPIPWPLPPSFSVILHFKEIKINLKKNRGNYDSYWFCVCVCVCTCTIFSVEKTLIWYSV